MNKVIAAIVVLLAIAFGVWFAIRTHLSRQRTEVAELLPATTLVLLEVPDFIRAREEWHKSDLYRIWQEPTVQAALQTPLRKLAANHSSRPTLEEFLQLKPANAYIGLTGLENNEPKIAAGFHFDSSVDEAQRFVERREAELLSQKDLEVKRQAVAYGDHKIERVRLSRFEFAHVFDGHWYLAATDVSVLQTLIDRVDQRTPRGAPALAETDVFRAATKHVPSSYAVMFFLQPQPILEKLMPLLAIAGSSASPQVAQLKQIKSVANTMRFEQGRMHETTFIEMPKQPTTARPSGRSLSLANADTFFYSDSLLHWTDQWPAAWKGQAGLPALISQVKDAFATQGVSAEDLRKAFGEELEVMGEWPANNHWPAVMATLAVKDANRARKAIAALASVPLAGAEWSRRDEKGITYYNAEPFHGLVQLGLTMAVSDRDVVVGSDTKAVSTMISKTAPSGEGLAKSASFREASDRVPPPDTAFNYVDSRLLLERIDQTVRPLLTVAATFYPAIGKSFDVNKLPPAEAIGKHLSPIVMSQRYVNDGYVTESVGPITFQQAVIGGVVAGATAGYFAYFHSPKAMGIQSGPRFSPAPTPASPSVTPTPSSTPF